jgi:hypothetical protein
MEPQLIRLDQHTPGQLEWLWPLRIPLGGLTLSEGDPGTNKSTMLYDIAARVTTGHAMPSTTAAGRPPSSVILLQAEDSLDTTQRNLKAAGADLKLIFAHAKSISSSAPALTFPDHIESLAAETEKTGAKLIVIDPISAYFTVCLTNDQAIRRVTQPLAAMAERLGVAVVLVRHLTKSGGRSPLYRGAGSIGLIAASRSGLLVAADPGNPAHRVLAQAKASLAGEVPSLSFRPIPKGGGLAIEWLGVSQFSPEQLLEAGRSGSRGELHDAIYVLYSILGDRPVLASEAKRLAAAAGVADRTLRRAKEVLKVDSQRRGFGKGSKFWWALPAEHGIVSQLRNKDMDNLMDRLCGEEDTRPTGTPEKPEEEGKPRRDHDEPEAAGGPTSSE